MNSNKDPVRERVNTINSIFHSKQPSEISRVTSKKFKDSNKKFKLMEMMMELFNKNWKPPKMLLKNCKKLSMMPETPLLHSCLLKDWMITISSRDLSTLHTLT